MAIDPRIASNFEAQNGFPLEPHLVVQRLFGGVEAARAGSPLPPKPDANAANDLLIDLHRRFLGLAHL